MKAQIQAHICAIRIILLILIIIGLGLLITQAYWVPSLVQGIMSHEKAPLVVSSSTPTGAPAKSPKATPALNYTKPGVEVSVLIGPTCPVQTASQACADKPLATTTIVFVNTATGKEAVAAMTNDAGHISQDLNAGTYSVHAQSSVAFPHLTPVTFTIPEHTRVKITLHFDSGIR